MMSPFTIYKTALLSKRTVTVDSGSHLHGRFPDSAAEKPSVRFPPSCERRSLPNEWRLSSLAIGAANGRDGGALLTGGFGAESGLAGPGCRCVDSRRFAAAPNLPLKAS